MWKKASFLNIKPSYLSENNIFDFGHFTKSTKIDLEVEKSCLAVAKLEKIFFNVCCSLASLRYAFVEDLSELKTLILLNAGI